MRGVFVCAKKRNNIILKYMKKPRLNMGALTPLPEENKKEAVRLLESLQKELERIDQSTERIQKKLEKKE